MIKTFGTKFVVNAGKAFTAIGSDFSMLRTMFDPEGVCINVYWDAGTLWSSRAHASSVFSGFCTDGQPCEQTMIKKEFANLSVAVTETTGITKLVVCDVPKDLVMELFNKHATILGLFHISTLDGKLIEVGQKEILDAMAFIVKNAAKEKNKDETEEAILAKAKAIEEARKKK